ncbi:unnamed protein product, partial [Amoebophrya sp. A120]
KSYAGHVCHRRGRGQVASPSRWRTPRGLAAVHTYNRPTLSYPHFIPEQRRSSFCFSFYHCNHLHSFRESLAFAHCYTKLCRCVVGAIAPFGKSASLARRLLLQVQPRI